MFCARCKKPLLDGEKYVCISCGCYYHFTKSCTGISYVGLMAIKEYHIHLLTLCHKCTERKQDIESIVKQHYHLLRYLDKSPARHEPYELDELLKDFDLNEKSLHEIKERMLVQMSKGLSKGEKRDCDLLMLPTYVRGLPDGTERGKYVALDLGGTHFRVLVVSISDGETDISHKSFAVPQKVMKGDAEQLFDYLAECIAIVVSENDLTDYEMPLGFTFSFPCKLNGLSSATLLNWTKGFNVQGVVGEDVVKKLNEALELRESNVRIEAIINDTVGCLCTGAFEDPFASIGVIYGTGTNACYIEKIENIHTFNDDGDEPDQMVINTEFGAFGNHGCLDEFRTNYDVLVDTKSINPEKQIYEKMISGMYMGEICRCACIDFANQGIFFNGLVGDKFKQQYVFKTEYVSAIVADQTPNLERIHYILHYELDIPTVSRQDCVAVQQLCKAVSKRAAKLAAAGLAALIEKVGKSKITVVVDGSLYHKHEKFRGYLHEYVCILVPSHEVSYKTAQDASGRGAALVAATSIKLKSRRDSLMDLTKF